MTYTETVEQLKSTVKTQAEDILKKAQVITEYKNKLKDLDKEITELEEKNKTNISFDVFNSLEDKKKYRNKLSQRFKYVDKRVRGELSKDANELSDSASQLTRYVYKNDEVLEDKLNKAKVALVEGYRLYLEYEQEREDIAERLESDLEELHYSKAAKYTSRMTYYTPSNYLQFKDFNIDVYDKYNTTPSRVLQKLTEELHSK